MTSVSVEKNFLAVSFEEGTLVLDFSETPSDKLFECSSTPKNKNDVVDGTIGFRCCALSSDLKYIVFCWHKELYIHQLSKWDLICQKELKRATSRVEFTPKSNNIVIADKSGDVYLFDMIKNEIKLILGHVSIILDFIITQDEKYIITCDRDEKIRVSEFPNSYTIQSFCLGHKEFVMTLNLLNQNLLLSGSGDGTIRIWDYIQGKQLNIFDCSQIGPYKNENGQNIPRAVIKIITIQTEKYSLICSIFKDFNGILVHKITPDLKCSFHQIVQLNSEPLAMSLNKTEENIWILNQDSTLSLYTISEDKLDLYNPEYLNNINTSLSKYKKIFLNAPIMSKIVSSFYKKSFDNVEEYFKRKFDRLENSNKKVKATQ